MRPFDDWQKCRLHVVRNMSAPSASLLVLLEARIRDTRSASLAGLR